MSSRYGTKYRPSLSCSVCRRRKVKCGKEKPACGNCVRMNEVCEYDRAPDTEDGRLQQTITPPSNGNPDQRKRTSSPVDYLPQQKLQRLLGSVARDITPLSSKIPQIRGHLANKDRVRPRFVNNTFWGFVPTAESLCNEILNLEHKTPNASKPVVNVSGILSLIPSLPLKPISDAFFSSFMTGARPLHCLIAEKMVRAAYDACMVWSPGKPFISLPTGLIFFDPTVVCLVFSILYCGAIIAPPSLWDIPVLKDLHKETIIEHLSKSLYAGLEHAQYRKAPTLNTMSALLLARSCGKKPNDPPLEDLFFFDMIVRMAQSMGLHREDALAKMDDVPRELSRRIYWHVRWLDVQVSLMNGSDTVCGSSESIYDTKLPIIEEPEIGAMNCGIGPNNVIMNWTEGFVSKIFTIGRFETARLQQSLIHLLSEVDQMECSKIALMVDALDKLHTKMDSLISQIPADGIPERGMVPARLANASPLTHQRLYADDINEPTVFGSWVRIVLSVFKVQCSITLHKVLLGRPDFAEEAATWDILIEYCLANLRNFVQLVQTPAFQPYLWFSTTRCGPLQAANLGIIYLQRDSQSEKGRRTKYFIDEVIDFYVPANKNANVRLNTTETVPTSWKMLKTIRARLDEPPGARQSLDDLATEALASSSTSDIMRGSFVSQEQVKRRGYSDNSTPLHDTSQGTFEHESTERLEKTVLNANHNQHGLHSRHFEEISQQVFQNVD